MELHDIIHRNIETRTHGKTILVNDGFDWVSMESYKDYTLIEYKNQVLFRLVYEPLRDTDVPILVISKRPVRNDFIADFCAKAEVIDITPQNILAAVGIELDAIINQVFEKEEFETFLSKLQAMDSVVRFDREGTLDFLLEKSFGLPMGDLTDAESYFWLYQLRGKAIPQILKSRLRQRMKSDFCVYLFDDNLYGEFQQYLLLTFILHKAGLDLLSVQTVLGNICFHFKNLDKEQLILLAEELLSTRLSFAKEQLCTLRLSGHQEETLFQLLSGKRELFYPCSLIKNIDKIAEELVTGIITVESATEQLRQLHSHLFASDYKEELQWLASVIDYIQYAEPLAEGVGERSEQVQTPSIPNSWEEWASFYMEKVAPLTLRYEQISTKEHPILKRLKSSHSELLRSLDISFADFVDNDAQWNALYEGKQEYTILSIPKKLKLVLDEGRQLYVVFIDALRYDCWLHLRALFEKAGFFVHTEKPCFSSLPTETFYTKASLFAGTLREGIDPNIGEFSYLLSLSAGKIHYERHADNLTIAEVQGIFQADSRVKIFSYNLLDEGVKNDFLFDTPLETVKLLFQKLQPIVHEAQEAQAYLVIISDHGFRELSVEEEMVEAVAEEIATVRANRVITPHASVYQPFLHAIMKENKFYMVADYQARQKTQGSQAKRYSHGGVSLHEFIVPYAALSYAVPKFHPLLLTLKESELLEAQKNRLVLTIQNKNVGRVRLVELDALFDEMVFSDGKKRQERRKVYDIELDKGENSIPLVLELGVQPEFETQNLDLLPKELVVSFLCEWQGKERKIEEKTLEFVIRKNPQVTTSKMDDVLKELL